MSSSCVAKHRFASVLTLCFSWIRIHSPQCFSTPPWTTVPRLRLLSATPPASDPCRVWTASTCAVSSSSTTHNTVFLATTTCTQSPPRCPIPPPPLPPPLLLLSSPPIAAPESLPPLLLPSTMVALMSSPVEFIPKVMNAKPFRTKFQLHCIVSTNRSFSKCRNVCERSICCFPNFVTGGYLLSFFDNVSA